MLDEREKPTLKEWAKNTLASLPWPLITCEPVLTEAAHFLRTAAPLVEMVDSGELLLPFAVAEEASELMRILNAYHERKVALADACLLRMTELWRDSTVITIDTGDFSIYRRFGREPIRFIAPPKQ